ncbi:MAG: GAF domain-containing protein [Chloroflexota bacterium]
MTTQEIILINGRYERHESIGFGGKRGVYRATDRLTGDEIALKYIPLSPKQPQSSNSTQTKTDQNLKMALAQALQILVRLHHPNIIRILDYGFDDEQQPFFTMTYLPQAQTVLQAGVGLTQAGKVSLLKQLLQAVSYLHRQGIVHGDLGPENVVVEGQVVRVLDFGLSISAPTTSANQGLSRHNKLPALLDLKEVSKSSDLYAIGAMAYALFAEYHSVETTADNFTQQVQIADSDLGDLTPPLITIIKRLLAKQPSERYHSAEACLAALDAAFGTTTNTDNNTVRESYPQVATFIGREAEMQQLQLALTDAKDGDGTVWLIGGESGVGKSRLLEEFRIYALVSGWQIWTGQASTEGGGPYHLWRDIVLGLSLNTTLTDLEAGVLCQAFPKLTHLLNRAVPAPPILTGEVEQQRLTLTFIDVLRRQTKPTLLLLEDLQWARESLSPLKQILNILTQLPQVMVVGTYRDNEAPTLADMLPGSHLLRLSRLSPDEIAQLSEAMLGEIGKTPPVISLLTQETEGNAFFVVEAMQALVEEAGRLEGTRQVTLPSKIFTRGMQAILQRRIQLVPEAHQNLLQLAAISGRQLDKRLLRNLAPDMDVDAWLQNTLGIAVLMVRNGQWLFTHDKLRETILADLNTDELQQLHRQVAQAIEQVYGDDQGYHQALLEHWHQAGDLAQEIHYLLLVAKEMTRNTVEYAYANDILARGLALIPLSEPRRVPLLNLQAEANSALGNYTQAHHLSQAAYQLSQQVNDQLGLATSLYNLGQIARRQEKFELADDLLRQSLDAYRTSGDKAGIARGLNELGILTAFQGEYQQAWKYQQQSLEFHQASDDQRGLAQTHRALGVIAFIQKDYALGERYLAQSIDLYQTIGDQFGFAYALGDLGEMAHYQDKETQAHHYYQQSLNILQAIGDQHGIGINLMNLGELSYEAGHHQQAHDYFQRSLSIFRAIQHQQGISSSFRYLGLLYLKLGQVQEAQRLFGQSLSLAHNHNIPPNKVEALMGFSAFFHQQGNLTQAAELAGLAISHPTRNNQVQRRFDQLMPLLKGKLTPAALQAATERGKTLDFDQLIQELLTEFSEASSGVKWHMAPTKLTNPNLLEHLLAVSRRMAERRKLDDLLVYAIDEVLRLVGGERGYIILMDEAGELDFRVRRKIQDANPEIPATPPSKQDTVSYSILDQVLQTGRSLVVENAFTDFRFQTALSVMKMRLRSILCVPLITQDRTIGAIYVENRTEAGRFSEDDIVPLEFFSNQAAVLIENVDLYNNLETLVAERSQKLVLAQQETERRYHASRQLNLATNLDEVLQTLAHLVDETGQAYASLNTIELDEHGTPVWAELVAASNRADMPLDTRFYLPDYPAAKLWLNLLETPLLVSNIESDEQTDPQSKQIFAQIEARSYIVMPLKVNKAWVGLIHIMWPEPRDFSKADEQFIQSIMPQTSVIVSNQLNYYTAQQNEEELRIVFDHAPYAIVLLNTRTNRFEYGNANAERLFGVKNENLAQISPIDVSAALQPDSVSPSRVFDEMMKSTLDNTPYEFEWHCQNLTTDETIPCETHWIALPGERAHLLRGSLTDVRQKKETQVTLNYLLKETEEQSKRLAGLNDMVIGLSQVSTAVDAFTLVAQKTKQILSADRVSVALLNNEGLLLLFAVDGTAGGRALGNPLPIDETTLVGTVITKQVPMLVSDTVDSQWLDVQRLDQMGLGATLVVPLISAGHVIGTLNTAAKDASIYDTDSEQTLLEIASILATTLENRQLYEQAVEAKEKAEIANRAKSEFLSHMSHELRTPLNGILGYAQILQGKDHLDDHTAESVGMMQQSGEHLLTLIEDMLDLAKIEAQRMELLPEPTHLPSFFKTVTSIIQTKAQKSNIAFAVDLAKNLPLSILVDATRLRQVVLNLLGNAVKFTLTGRITFRVSQVPQRNETMSKQDSDITLLRFEVEDTGIGIEVEQLETIFQPFEQAGDQRHRAKGVGLGLPISYQLVDLMGGDLMVESQIGQGSRFWFEIAVPIVSGDIPTVDEPKSRIIGFQPNERFNQQNPIKVLVVDDIAENRAMIQALLSPLGFTIFEAADGQEGLSQAQQHQPDVIVLDKVMPVLDGLATARQMRQMPALKETVIIIASASVFEQDYQASLAAGANAFVPKPIYLENLLKEIKAHLNVTWIYAPINKMAPSGLASQVEAGSVEIIPPPPEEMATLYELAVYGNMRRIQEQADHIVSLGQQYAPFAHQLRILANEFEEEKILSLVKQYFDPQGEDHDSTTV